MFGGMSEQNLICLFFALVFLDFLDALHWHLHSLSCGMECAHLALDSLQVGAVPNCQSIWVIDFACACQRRSTRLQWFSVRYKPSNVWLSFSIFLATCLLYTPTSPTCHCELFGSVVISLPVLSMFLYFFSDQFLMQPPFVRYLRPFQDLFTCV